MEKLIRDKTHTIPHSGYPNIQIRKVVDIMEHIQLLISKVIEEQQEFDIAIGIGKIEEAGDFFEVYDTLIHLYIQLGDMSEQTKYIDLRNNFITICTVILGLDIDTILTEQTRKREMKGGFGEGIVGIF